MKTRLAIILALIMYLAVAVSASAKVATDPDTQAVVFEDKTYTVSVDEIGTDEKGNTTVTLDGVGDSMMIRDGEFIMHILASIKSKGKEYECQSASFQGGKATYYFDKVLEPDAILVYSYGNPDLRKEFALSGVEDASPEAIPASDDFTYTLEDDLATITAYVGSEENLDIPAELDGYPVTAIGADAFSDCQSLARVTIPDGVSNIGDYAFYNCGALASVEIPGSTKSIGESAFSSCAQLKDVTLSDGIEDIGGYAFEMCSAMTGIEIPASVKSIGAYSFDFCSSLSAINVAKGNSSFMSQDGVLFDKLQTLLYTYPAGKAGKSYKIPKGVTTIGANAFACSELVKITIPDSVTEIGEMAFANCLMMKSVTIPMNVAGIGEGAFGGCINLGAITLAKGNAAYTSVKGVLFDKEGKTLLAYPMVKAGTSYTIPSGVERIGAGAFDGCGKLASVSIPESVKTIGINAFFGCDTLAAVTIPEGVTDIGDFAFSYCESLVELTLPESLESTGTNIIYRSGECILIVTENSYAHLFAQENGMSFDLSK